MFPGTRKILECLGTRLTHRLISPAGVDYEVVTTNLIFNDSMSTQVVTILILLISFLKTTNSFYVTLTTFDTAPTLRLQTTCVTIRDNDNKIHCTQLYIYHSLMKNGHGWYTLLCAQTRVRVDICNIAALYHEKAPSLHYHNPQ